MKPTSFSIILLLTLFTITLSEYPRLKYRGPAHYPKPPPYQQIHKKWQHQPPRPPVRSRPIPVHMPSHHKIPIGMAASINRPVAVPVRNLFWKNQQTTFKTPINVNNNHILANNNNYNNKNNNKKIINHGHVPHNIYNINNNNNNNNKLNNFVTSAPVLPNQVFQSSPAILAQEYDFRVESNNIPTPIKTIRQIGEKGPIHTIPAPNLSLADKPLVIEEVKKRVEEVKRQPEVASYVQEPKRQSEIATYVQIQKSHQYQVTEAPEKIPTFTQNFPQNYPQPLETPHNPSELYHLLNNFSQQQPTATITVPFLQNAQDYLLIPQQTQNYLQEHVALDKSFEESAKKDQSRKDLSSSLVTAAYNLDPEGSESIIRSQYVQNYFDTRTNNNNNNLGKNTEPDAKPSSDKPNYNNNDEENGFYVSLPNKEAAEKLASLQAAGKLNNKLKEMGNIGELPVSIYVPEDGEVNQSDDGEESNYDDYSQDDLIDAINEKGEEFGVKLQPKK